MCFNRYANYFPHNSHIIDLLCCKYVISLGWRSMSDLLCCKYVMSLLSENIRKHRRLEFCYVFHTIQFTLQRCLGNLRDLKTYEFHRCIAECGVRSSNEIIFTGNGGKCAKIRLISWWRFVAWNICKIFDASQVDTRRKSEESREILIGWKRDRLNGTHRSITYILHASLSRGNISLSQTPQRSLSNW